VTACPALKKCLIKNKFNGEETINFSDQKSVKLLNKAILKYFYQISDWDIPPHYLCPPIPGRADYIHYMADILAEINNLVIPRGKQIRVLDVGTGANCVYPLIGIHQYGWSFIGSDIDKTSIDSAKKILSANKSIEALIELRLQTDSSKIFENIILPDEKFDFTICNPPFHTSESQALEGTQRKLKNLGIKNKSVLNFGGQNNELWYPGGELEFIRKMIIESVTYSKNCLWFSSLVSKKENLSSIYGELKRANVVQIKTIEMAQGQKISRFIAWSFYQPNDQNLWRKERWI
jgi:23S rRNA (adenine1618-N6)-methyltransferase